MRHSPSLTTSARVDGRGRRALRWGIGVLCAAAPLSIAAVSSAADRADQASETAPLRVATKPIAPFVILDAGDPAAAPTGFSIDLWNRIGAELGRPTQWVRKQKVGEVVDAVAGGEADVGIAAISVTAEREERIDFTHSFFDSGLQVLISSKGEERGFLSAFSWIASRNFVLPLVLFFGIIVLFGHLIWWIERRENDDFPNGYRRGIVEGMWWSLATVTGGDAEKSVNRPLGRLISAVWLVFGLFLVAYVTGLVTSNLTVDRLQSSIRSVDDIAGKNIVCVPDTVAAKFLSGRGIRFTPVDTVDAAVQAVADGAADATVYDSPVLVYAAATSAKGRVQVVGPIFHPDKYAIALPSGSPLREPVNDIVLRLQADGTLDDLYRKWFKAQ